MDSLLMALIIVGIVALSILSLVFIYLFALTRRTHIVMKKFDYIVEDMTYKMESLNVTVDAINKVSNYVLTFDSFTKKSVSSLIKLISQNRNFIYSFFNKMKNNVQTSPAVQVAKKPTTKSVPKSKTTNSLKKNSIKTNKGTKK